MITGELDYVYGNALSDITVAENIVSQNPDTTYAIQSSTYNRKLFFNLLGRGDDKKNDYIYTKEFRQAINLLLDKEAMASVYAGQAEPLTTFVPNGDPLYNSDIPVHKRDVAAAKALLDSIGFDYSTPIEVITYYTDQATADLMGFMKQNLEEAGLTVEVAILDAGAFTAREESGNWDIEYASNGARTLATMQYETVCAFFSQDYGMKEERAQVCEPDYNAWLAAQDEAEARKYSDALQATLVDNCYQIPIYAMNTIVTYNTRVQLPEGMCNYDNMITRNWHWDEWALN